MSFWEHARHKIFTTSQHPLVHDIGDFFYANERIPGLSRLNDVLDYIISVLYPNFIGHFDTFGDLPASPDPNDYAIVDDDGDGKAAGYIWSTIDGAGQWIKRYDMDWATEDILAEAVNRTLPLYVQKYGIDDKDAAGSTIAGLYAGQRVYGGASANTNLTLDANAGDTGGGRTGYVQVSDDFRPAIHNTLSCGTDTERWAQMFTGELTVGTMSFAGGSISDTSGAIDFNDLDLSTTGHLSVDTFGADTSAIVADLVLSGNAITSPTGTIDFDDEDLETTGTLTAGSGSAFGNLTLSDGIITSASGALSFDNENLTTTGTLGAGNTTVTRLDADNIRLDGNSVSILDVNGGLNLAANGSGVVNFASAMTTLDQTVTGAVAITGSLAVDNFSLNGNALSISNANGNLTLSANGTGSIIVGHALYPSGSFDLGKTGNTWNKLWISGSIGDSSEITIEDLLSLRHVPYRDIGRTIPAETGDSLYYDAAAEVWLASHPDTEIVHEEISGLTDGDAGHTQFVLLTGRAGGQVIQGGTAAAQSLTLESTANASKGSVQTRDPIIPETTASFSVTWSGTDIGDGTHHFRDVFTKGEFKGLRFENTTSGALPSASASAKGRGVFATDTNKLMLDIGGSWLPAGVSKYLSDTSWNGTDTTQDFTVSSSIQDARTAIWQLCDNSNNYERIWCSIQAISATQVRVTVGTALPAGSYRLIGIE